MITPATASDSDARAIGGFEVEPDLRALLVGAAIALCLGVFAFHPGSWGIVFLGIALAAGIAFPLSGVVAIALAITTLPLVRWGGVLADIRGDELLGLVVIASVGIRALVTRSVPRNEVITPTIVFVVISALSIGLRFAVTDFRIRLLAIVLPLAKHLIRLLLFLAVVWLATRARRGLATIAVSLAIGGVLGGLFGIAQSLVPRVEDFLVAYYPSIRAGELRLFWGHRAFAAFDGNPNHLAVTMFVLALLALAIADRSMDRRSKTVWFVAALPMLFAIIASSSRATCLVAVVLFLAAWLWQKRRLYLYALASMVAYAALVPNLLRTRLAQLVVFHGGGISAESDVLRKLSAWANPFGQRQTLRMTDNFYLDVLVNFWPLALLAFLWLVWVVFRRLWREYRLGAHEPGYVQAALMSWVAVVILSLNGAFFSVPRVSEVLWLVLGLAWGWFAVRDTNGQAGASTIVPAGPAGEPTSSQSEVALFR